MKAPKKQRLFLDSSNNTDIKNWDWIASRYHKFIEQGDIFRKQLVDPVVLSWLGNPRGKKILDAGCGDGYLSKTIANSGAEVIGVDGSKELIKIAQSQYRDQKIKFLEADLRKPLPFADSEFDFIVCSLVLMDFDPIDTAINEFSRALRDGGQLIISLLHPAFVSGKLGKSIKEFLFYQPPHYRISGYHTHFKKSWFIQGVNLETNYYHRPLEYYFKLLTEASFNVTELKEQVFNKEFVKDKNNFIKLCAEVPIFIIFRAEKNRVSYSFSRNR